MRTLRLIAVAVAMSAIVFAFGYIDYTIYKAKYPDTTFWMWLVDGK